MTREELKMRKLVRESDVIDKTDGSELARAFNHLWEKYIEQEPYDFARWVATEIFDENWEYNKDSFAEIACRKLAKLGIVRAKGDEWELIESQESEE